MFAARMILFLDAKNFLDGARMAFFAGTNAPNAGQIHPLSLGTLLCRRYAPGPPRELHEVRVYVDEPVSTGGVFESGRLDAWRESGIVVIHPSEAGEGMAVETLAADYKRLALSEACDVGVIASSDMRLSPAIAYVLRYSKGSFRPELVEWKVARSRASRQLKIGGKRIYCHWLMRGDYEEVADPLDYTVPLGKASAS